MSGCDRRPRTIREYGSSRWDSRPASPARSTGGSARAPAAPSCSATPTSFPPRRISRRWSEFFAEHARAGAAIGKLLRYDLATDRPTDIIDTAGLLLTRQRRLMPRGEGERDSGQFDDAVEVFAVDGAAPVLRRSALEAISVRASIWTRTSSRTRKTTTCRGVCGSQAGSAGTCRALSLTTAARRAVSGRAGICRRSVNSTGTSARSRSSCKSTR